jgi:hypothetical protein
MRAAADGEVSSSDEEGARQLEEQELIQRACQESFLAAGPTGYGQQQRLRLGFQFRRCRASSQHGGG